jgi:Fe-S cluster assembly protein SufB
LAEAWTARHASTAIATITTTTGNTMTDTVDGLVEREYAFGFHSDIETDRAPKGLTEDTIRFISAKKNEPDWMLQWRLSAYEYFKTQTEPQWARISHPEIDYQDMYYWAAPKPKGEGPKSLDEVDPEIRETFDKLGISLDEQKRLSGVAVDAIIDSVSVVTTFKATLAEAGVIFCSFSEAVADHPELVRKYLGSVVGPRDNFFAALNSAVFSDGSFCFVPAGVKCPMELSTYFRINAENTGQFERTLIVAEEGASVSYLEGCTAPMRDENQLHAAVVEIIALDDSDVKYSTVQNWYPGDADGVGGIYNFVTKRGRAGNRARISWTQVETGSAITWKYPSVILQGDDSVGEFYSVAVTTNHQQADTGTKMIHIGRNTSSTIVSKGISAGVAQNTYRGQVKVLRSAEGARNFTQCDSLLMGPDCGAHTFPYVEVRNDTAQIEHEASTSKIDEDQLFYCRQRGLSEEDATNMIVNGFCREVFDELPMEYAVEAQALMRLTLEGAVG